MRFTVQTTLNRIVYRSNDLWRAMRFIRKYASVYHGLHIVDSIQ